jgi:hypothetical protein
MSILDNNDNVERPSPAKRSADRLRQMTRQVYNQMLYAFNNGAELFWTNRAGATPEEIAAELGLDAKEIFELHAKLGELLGSVRPEDIQKGLSVVGNFTMNDDGSVTVHNEGE